MSSNDTCVLIDKLMSIYKNDLRCEGNASGGMCSKLEPVIKAIQSEALDTSECPCPPFTCKQVQYTGYNREPTTLLYTPRCVRDQCD